MKLNKSNSNEHISGHELQIATKSRFVNSAKFIEYNQVFYQTTTGIVDTDSKNEDMHYSPNGLFYVMVNEFLIHGCEMKDIGVYSLNRVRVANIGSVDRTHALLFDDDETIVEITASRIYIWDWKMLLCKETYDISITLPAKVHYSSKKVFWTASSHPIIPQTTFPNPVVFILNLNSLEIRQDNPKGIHEFQDYIISGDGNTLVFYNSLQFLVYNLIDSTTRNLEIPKDASRAWSLHPVVSNNGEFIAQIICETDKKYSVIVYSKIGNIHCKIQDSKVYNLEFTNDNTRLICLHPMAQIGLYDLENGELIGYSKLRVSPDFESYS